MFTEGVAIATITNYVRRKTGVLQRDSVGRMTDYGLALTKPKIRPEVGIAAKVSKPEIEPKPVARPKPKPLICPSCRVELETVLCPRCWTEIEVKR